MTTTRTATELVGLLKTCKAVKSVNPWKDRFYLELWDASGTFRGDQTAKWFVDGRGVLNYESGKGTRSEDFRSSVEILNAFLVENGIEVRKVA